MNKRAHVFIYGDVIGVGFRSWMLRNARNLGLTGWVKNASSNLVEAVFEGSKEKVEEMIKLCYKGPEVAWVEKVKVVWEEVTGEFWGFEIRY
jgi:acylphosphatase